jgi:protein-S-isoprenylcysteine O-methyltransferase Ste14
MLVVLRTCLLARWVAVAAFVFNPSWLSWSSMSTAMELRWITATFEIASTSAMLWVFYTLGRNLTDTVLVRSRGQLVMAGPYRFVRHPLYTAFGCMALADPLVMDSWAVGLVDIAILGILVQRTRIEEAKLLERFGDSYREYSRRTPAFIPGWPVQACSVPPQES